MSALLIHTLPHRFPNRIRRAPELGHLSVIVEPEHAGRYDAGVDVELVDNVQDLDQVHRAALAVFRRRRIDHVVSPFEFTVPVAAYMRTRFGIPGTGFDTAIRFTDKNVMKRSLAAAGLPVAPFRVGYSLDDVPAAAEELGWPVVIKPAVGGGCMDVFTVSGPDELARLAGSMRSQQLRTATCPIVIEKRLNVIAEYHCDGVVHDGKTLFAAASRYLVPILRRRDLPHLSGSYCLPPGHPAEDEIRRLHDEAIRALGLDCGVSHLEVLHTPSGFVIGEIACRIGGGGISRNVWHQFGVDLWREWLLSAVGLAPELPYERADRICAYYQLPVRAGRVTALADVEALRAVPSVTAVDTHLNVGDEVPGRRSSSVTAATVYLSVADEDELADRVRRLGEVAESR